MASVASPYGLRPVQLLGGGPFAGAIRSFPLTVDVAPAKAFYFGDPVGLQAGQPKVLAASPTSTVGPDSPIGIFMGCEWVDNIRGFVNAQSFPAGGIAGGAKNVKFKILVAPDCVFKVQANGPVTAAQVGFNAPLVAFGTGNASSGDSLVAIGAPAVTATFAVKIIGFPDMPNSQPGDAFTDVLVIWNAGVHRFANATGL